MRQAGLGSALRALPAPEGEARRRGPVRCRGEAPAAAAPARIGVLTSLAAAALRDVLTTLARRNPAIPVVVYPVPVQGEGAAERIAAMLRRAERARRVRRAAPGARRRLARGPVAVQRGGAGARHPRLRHPGGGRRRPRDRLHHRRLRRRPARADAHRGGRAGEPVARCSSPRCSPTARAVSRAKCAGGSTTRRKAWTPARGAWCIRASGCARIGSLVAQLSARLGFAFLHRLRAVRGEARAPAGRRWRALDPTAVLERGYSITYGANGAVLRDAPR